jgi:hypothetical protein
MVRVMALVLGAALWTPPLVRTELCAKKRVDSCGCHHVFGVRHCHPNRRSAHCEAVAQPEPPKSANAPELICTR